MFVLLGIVAAINEGKFVDRFVNIISLMTISVPEFFIAYVLILYLAVQFEIFPSLEQLPLWGFDGSSTEQATGDSSDCILKPVFHCPDPIRGGKNILVMCEVMLAATGEPHPTNTRAATAAAQAKHKDQDMWYEIGRAHV